MSDCAATEPKQPTRVVVMHVHTIPYPHVGYTVPAAVRHTRDHGKEGAIPRAKETRGRRSAAHPSNSLVRYGRLGYLVKPVQKQKRARVAQKGAAKARPDEKGETMALQIHVVDLDQPCS